MKKMKLTKYIITLMTALLVMGMTSNSVLATKFPVEYDNHKKVKKGGTLRVGYVHDGVFKGVFADVLSVDGPTTDVAQFGNYSLFKPNNDYTYSKDGLAQVSFNNAEKTATVKIKKNAGWSDGHPLEAKDIEYTYKVVANSATDSGSYNAQLRKVVGIEDYHAGKTDKISGLEVKDLKTMVIHFTDMEPEMKFPNAGFIVSSLLPYHYLKDVPFDKLASSDKVQKDPLFYGPFKIKNMVRGQSVSWVPNEYYGGKRPNVSKINIEMVSSGQAAAAMRANKYDILLNESGGTYKKVRKLQQYAVLGVKEKYYSYVGFKVGHANKEGLSVMDRKTPVQDRVLRQAMGYALNMDQLSKKFDDGLYYRANTVVPDAFGKYNDHKAKGYTLDLKKANKLLDKAGYKLQKNGYRTLPNGKKFSLKLLSEGGNSSDERAMIQNYLEQWKKIGVKVELKDGRLQEFNSYIEQLVNDGKGFDVWLSNWAVPMPPTTSVAGNYMPSDPYNFAHFVTKENTELIESLSSKKAFNDKYQLKQFYKWQEYMNKEAYIVPRQFRYSTYVFSKKLTNISLKPKESYNLWENIAFTK